MKVGDLVRDWEGDVFVYFTTYCDVEENESILIDKESIVEVVCESR